MSAFVGTCMVASAEALRSLLQQHQTEKSCFFLRWPHQVGGFCHTLPPDFPSPEGQLFDSKKELRWKQQGQGYSVLLLSETEKLDDFETVEADWETCDRSAKIYPPTETRLPYGIADNGINIEQRYFRDKKTAMVHFVALVTK